MQTLLSRLIFPFTMVVALLAVYWLTEHRGINPAYATIAVLLVVGAWIWAWELLMPYRKQWNRNDGDLKTDVMHMLVSQVTVTNLAKPLFILALFPVIAFLGERFGSDALWPNEWPLIAQLVLMLVIAEFGRYWVHRAAHRTSWLWRFHAVHHSPNRLYWVNAGRFHPIEKVYLLIPEVVPFILLNTPETVLTLYLVVNGTHGFFQHSNIKLRLGWMNYIFSMTELHRWHHSKVIEQSDNNFGNILIIWDLVFGTFYLPKNKEVGSIGVLNPDYPKDYLGQLEAPFHYRRDKPADYEERKEYYHQQTLLEGQALQES